MTKQDTEIAPEIMAEAMARLAGPDGRISIDPETIEQDLARLVLGLMEFLRQLMELQAIRRMEGGCLSDQQIDQLGEGLMRSESAILDVAEKFGLEREDLILDLGPLGRTI